MLAFAGARDAIGTAELELPLAALEQPTAGAVLTALCERHPALAPRRAMVRLAVNDEYVDEDAPVAAGDVVALIPPVAGG